MAAAAFVRARCWSCLMPWARQAFLNSHCFVLYLWLSLSIPVFYCCFAAAQYWTSVSGRVRAVAQGEFGDPTTTTGTTPCPTSPVELPLAVDDELDDIDDRDPLPPFVCRPISPAQPIEYVSSDVEDEFASTSPVAGPSAAHMSAGPTSSSSCSTSASVVNDKVAALSRAVEKLDERLLRLEKPAAERQEAITAISSIWRCQICYKIPHAPDLRVTPCCMQMAGCDACMSRWLGEHNSCPICRATLAADGLATLPAIVSLSNALELLAKHC